MWSKQEQGQSSSFRELKAIYNVIELYAPLLTHSKVKLFSDNQRACTIVDKGSPKLILNQLATDIFVLALHNDITLCPQWIPKLENERADVISKFLDKNDWKINPMIFDQLNRLWGPHTVDRFSSHCNNQIQKFNSRFASPGCEALDALAQNWSIENNWVGPPVSMIISVIHHFMKCKAKGTLIIPECGDRLISGLLSNNILINLLIL